MSLELKFGDKHSLWKILDVSYSLAKSQFRVINFFINMSPESNSSISKRRFNDGDM